MSNDSFKNEQIRQKCLVLKYVDTKKGVVMDKRLKSLRLQID